MGVANCLKCFFYIIFAAALFFQGSLWKLAKLLAWLKIIAVIIFSKFPSSSHLFEKYIVLQSTLLTLKFPAEFFLLILINYKHLHVCAVWISNILINRTEIILHISMALSLPTNRLPQFKILILISYGWKEIVFTSGELFSQFFRHKLNIGFGVFSNLNYVNIQHCKDKITESW